MKWWTPRPKPHVEMGISTGGSLRNPPLEIPVFFKIRFFQTISDEKTPKIKVVRLKKL
jgi:hypothetical protein